MNRAIIGILFVLIFCNFIKDDYRHIPNDNINRGEYFEYKVKWGILTLGVATVNMDTKVFSMNGRPCYRVNVDGRTAGITDLFKIRNNYQSYFDTSAFVPHKFFYHAREDDYVKDQELVFNHLNNTVTRSESGNSKVFKVPNNVQDVVSAYYFLRTLDYTGYNSGQIISIPLFFTDEIYNLKVRMAGKGRISTSFGKISAFKLQPILPENKMFEGEDGIRVWVSDDENKIPLKIEVDFSFGTIVMDLKKHKNLKYPL